MTISPVSPIATNPSHAYMRPSTPVFRHIDDGEDPSLMEPEVLYEEVMNCGVPLLAAIEAQARGYQYGSPIGATAKAIATAACDAPKAAVLTGIGGRPAPLNFLFCFVAPSGIGKGLSLDAKMATAHPMNGYRRLTPASGEALIASFFDSVPAADGKGSETIRHDEPVWGHWGEIDQLAAKAGNSNATLDATVRSLWSGEKAGDVSITRMKAGLGTQLDPDSYRFVLTVGGQTDHLAIILHDETGGTLQRYLFVPILDDEAPATMGDIMGYRHTLNSILGLPHEAQPLLAPTISVWGPRAGVTVTEDVIKFLILYRAQILRSERSVDPLDTHENNLRVRLASVFAGWVAGEGNPAVVNREAWWWAGCFMALSRSLREECRKLAVAKKTETARDAGELDADRADARKEAEKRIHINRVLAAQDTVLRAVCRWAERDPRGGTARDIRSITAATKRDYVDEALEFMLDNNTILANQDGNSKRYLPNPKYAHNA